MLDVFYVIIAAFLSLANPATLVGFMIWRGYESSIERAINVR